MPSALIPLLAVTFVDILGFSILIPLLPFYAEHYGASPLVVGLLVSTVALCSLISSPILGALSDRVGRRGILLFTQIATTIAYVMLGLGGSLAMVFFSRMIEGFAGGGLGVTQAYISDVTEPHERGRAYALLGATFGVGFIVGPALGGTLVHFGYSVPFFTAACISLVTIFLTLRLLPESHIPLEKQPPLRETVRALFVPQMRRLLVIQLCFSLSFTMWVSVLALFLQHTVGFGPSQTSLFYATSGVIGVIMQTLVIGRLVDRLHERRVLLLGLACVAFGYGGVIGTHYLLQIAVLTAIWSIGSSLTRPMLSSLLSKAADKDQRGALLGGADAINNLSFVIGPILSTLIFSRNPQITGILPAILALTGAYFAYRVPPETETLVADLKAEAS